MIKWQKTQFPGIECYQHESRKHGIKFDAYFRGRFMFRGKTYISSFGWGSEKWTSKKAFLKLQEFKHNAKNGSGPTSLRDEQNRRDEADLEKARLLAAEITFSEFFKTKYLPAQHKKISSLTAEKAYFREWLAPELGHLPIKQITPFNLEKVKKNMLDAGRAPRTIQYTFAVFRQTWNTAKAQGLVKKESPTKNVKLPRFDNRRLRFLTQEEAEALLNDLILRSSQMHQLALLALHTGMRAGEIFSLSWSDVDLQNEVLTIRDSKSGKTRFCYLTTETKHMLSELSSKDGLVFLNRNGRKIKEVSNAFPRAVERLGFNRGLEDSRQKVTFHSLRHTFASWHVQGGTDLYVLKELLGHHSIQLTERYSHLRPDGLRKATKIFEERLKAEKEPSETKAKNALRANFHTI